MIPNLSSPELITYGIPELVEAYPHLFDGTASKTTVDHLDGNQSHATGVRNALKMPCPDVLDIDTQLFTSASDLITTAYNGTGRILNISADVTFGNITDVGMYRAIMPAIQQRGTIWLTHRVREESYPAKLMDEYDNILVTIPKTATPSNPDNAHICSIGKASLATPDPAGLIGILYALKPDLTHQEVMQLIFDGALKDEASLTICRYGQLHYWNTVQLLVERYGLKPPPVTEEPEEPMPEEPIEQPGVEMAVYEDPFIHAECPADGVEGFENLFKDNGLACTFRSNPAKVSVTVKKPLTLKRYEAPLDRDFEPTETEWIFESDSGLPVELDFVDYGQIPTELKPEVPQRNPVRLTLEYNDGSMKEIDL